MKWLGNVSGEGGPLVFLAEGDDWPGGVRAVGDQSVVRVWGQFTAELPTEFHPDGDGGHQFLECGSLAEARATLDRLQRWVVDRWPGTAVGDGSAGDLPPWASRILQRPDGRRMQAELHPLSAYDEACEASGPEAVWQHDGRTFWSLEGPGTAAVGLAEDGLVLARTWPDSEQAHARALDAAAAAGTEPTGVALEVTGPMSLVWAPIAANELVEGHAGALSTDWMEAVGLRLPLAEGIYDLGTGHAEGRDWAVTFCRLTRRSP